MSPITVRAQGICNLFKRILLRSSYNTECVLNLFESIMEDLLIGHAHTILNTSIKESCKYNG